MAVPQAARDVNVHEKVLKAATQCEASSRWRTAGGQSLPSG